MKKFVFEVQNCVEVEIEARNIEEARQELIDNLSDYASDKLVSDCCVSNGEEIK